MAKNRGEKYIPDAIKELAFLFVGTAIFMIILACLWIKRIVSGGRRPRRASGPEGMMAKNKGKEFVGPRGICVCGHTGNGTDFSEHTDYLLNGLYTSPGLGQCLMCDCEKYVLRQQTRKYQNFLAAQRKP